VDEPPTPSFTVRDSAGITIVDNRGPSTPASGGWSLSPDPILEIGAMEGAEAYQLFRVWGAFRLSDGRVAVVNHDAPDLRVFAPDGTHLHTFGRKGEGPGEFSSPVLAGVLPGDTLVVVDRHLRRINLFHPEQGFLRSAQSDPDFMGYLLTVGMFSSGSVVIWRGIHEAGEGDGYGRHPRQFLSFSRDGSVATDFGEFPGDEVVTATSQQTSGILVASVGSVPFGKRARAAVSGARMYYGSQDRYEIRVYDEAGDLVRLVRLDREPVPILQEHLNAYLQERLEAAEDPDQAQGIRRSMEEAPVPELFPAHGNLYADTLGFLFVEDYRLPGEEVSVLSVFDPEGRRVGSLALPPGLRVLDMGVDYVLGLHLDEVEVEYLHLYGLTRGPANPT
jgi:hypothetical protein